MNRKLALLLWCAAFGLAAYACLNYWSVKHAPLYRRFEWQWAEDIERLESSHKLPAAWNEVKSFKIIGGTPETRFLLPRVKVPLKTNPNGQNSMDVLIVFWEENGKRGALIQYNIEDLKTKNTVAEIARTLILEEAVH